MAVVGLDEARARWLRFSLKIAALWATVLGAVGYGLTGDLQPFWWGLRLTGGLVVCVGLLGLARHAGGRDHDTSGWTPSRALTGVVRVLLGSAVVLATL